jgi:hypothetical protein
MKLLVMQLSPPSRHSISLWSKYSPQHPVLKHLQFMFLPYCQRQCFTPIQNHRQTAAGTVDQIVADLPGWLSLSLIQETEEISIRHNAIPVSVQHVDNKLMLSCYILHRMGIWGYHIRTLLNWSVWEKDGRRHETVFWCPRMSVLVQSTHIKLV